MKNQRYILKLLIYVLLGVAPALGYPTALRRRSAQINNKTNLEIDKEQPRTIDNGTIISVRITSSVAVERGKKGQEEKVGSKTDILTSSTRVDTLTERSKFTKIDGYKVSASEHHSVTVLPPSLAGANIEFIKQLRSKKEGKSLHSNEHRHPFHLALQTQNETFADSSAEESQIDIQEDARDSDEENTVPRARSISLSPFVNRFHPSNSKVNVTRELQRNSTTTSVNIDVVHRPPSHPIVYSEPAKVYSEPAKVYSEPAKVYSKPEIFYSEPSKVYSEPAKVYGEPSKVYSEPAKVYSEPAKVYGEPSKFYSEPASLHLDKIEPPQIWEAKLSESSTLHGEKSLSSTYSPSDSLQRLEHRPEKESGEETTTAANKVGYVLEGDEYRKYRVEERTADGFIVGEYGVVSHNDGSLRGVRYTADGDTNPRLIYDALINFLRLTK